MTARCNLCRKQMPTEELLEHVRLLHPDDYEPVQTWSDGQPVIIDNTLEPEDFDDEQEWPD